MELQLVPLSYNLDAVLARLDGVQKDRKLRKKDLEQIFDSIVADESGRTKVKEQSKKCQSKLCSFRLARQTRGCMQQGKGCTVKRPTVLTFERSSDRSDNSILKLNIEVHLFALKNVNGILSQ